MQFSGNHFLPKLAEFFIANIGVLIAFYCLANERLASISGEAVRAFFKIGFSSLVRAECLILKKVREDFYFGYHRSLKKTL